MYAYIWSESIHDLNHGVSMISNKCIMYPVYLNPIAICLYICMIYILILLSSYIYIQIYLYPIYIMLYWYVSDLYLSISISDLYPAFRRKQCPVSRVSDLHPWSCQHLSQSYIRSNLRPSKDQSLGSYRDLNIQLWVCPELRYINQLYTRWYNTIPTGVQQGFLHERCAGALVWLLPVSILVPHLSYCGGYHGPAPACHCFRGSHSHKRGGLSSGASTRGFYHWYHRYSCS